jgi:hypothetical protein
MIRSLFTRRGVAAVAAASIGLTGMSLAFAGAAGAAPSASLMVGSGSQTSYAVMTALSDVFNNAAGCDLTAATSSPSTLNCGTSSFAPGTVGGEQGFNVSSENPYNDYTVQAPAIGSGNGRTALLASGAGTPTQQIDYARSSSFSAVGSTVNFVKYATDGVSWTTFNHVNGVATPQSAVTNISTANLKLIMNDTLSCVVGGVTKKMNWQCLGAATSNHIDCYMAQTGSGTYSTWSGYLGFTGNPACVKDNTNGDTTGAAHSSIFENQMSTIFGKSDNKNAIYFMSLGKYTTTCPGGVTGTSSPGVCAGTSANTFTTLGKIDTIKAKKSTVQGTGGGLGVTFPVTRGLYNVYNNSTALAPSSQATLNFVSEYGFLCKASATDIDPSTGVSFRTDIENAITAQGFFPLDVSGATFPEGTVTNPAVLTDAGYTAVDPTVPTNGFCLVSHG